MAPRSRSWYGWHSRPTNVPPTREQADMSHMVRTRFPALLVGVLVMLAACGWIDTAARAEAATPSLTPVASFALADAVKVTSVAMSPDGSRVVVATQERLGAPVTLRSYDASTGDVVATIEVKTLGLWRLHWMGDNRLVAADRDNRPGWRAWDGATLEELPTLAQDLSCADGAADRNAGAVYSSDGMASMSDMLCRFDTRDGSVRRTDEGVLVGAERFWVRAGSGEVVVLHSPDPDVSLELLTLDGTTLAPKGSMPIQFDEEVKAVGSTAWIATSATSTARLEPGAISVPDLSPIRVSGAGRVFVHANGMDDVVFVSAIDGRVLGAMPAGMNIAAFGDWSIDDSHFVRLTVDRTVEVYRF